MAQRLLYSKTGCARYVLHTDLMRAFQRTFARAKLALAGSPLPAFTGSLPLAVGHSSQCEILQFELVDSSLILDVPNLLTAVAPEGIIMHQCYTAQRNWSELFYINYIINFEYPEGRPQDTEAAMCQLLDRSGLPPPIGPCAPDGSRVELDLIPSIKCWRLECQRDTMTLDVVLRARDHSPDPSLILAAFCREYPELAPDFTTFHRRELLDEDGKPFR